VEPRAEVSVLLGELLAAICSISQVYLDPQTGAHFEMPPGCAHIPLPTLPATADPYRPRRIYVGGFGGAISHQVLNAMAIDPVLRTILVHPDSIIVGADDDVVEESNRSRQIGYLPDDIGRPKAAATRAWLARGPLAAAHVVDLNESVSVGHLTEHAPIDAVIMAIIDDLQITHPAKGRS
jgi:hypothetical protein